MQEKQNITIKNINRAGKFTFDSKYGELEIECYRLKGNANYRLKIEGTDKGIARQTALEVYEWCSSYLGIDIVQKGTQEEEAKPTKQGQSKWK